MITLFNIGDEIEVTLRGVVKEYSCSESGDCYTIVLPEQKNTRIYLDSETLKACSKEHKDINRWENFSENELCMILWALEYYINQNDEDINGIQKELRDIIKARKSLSCED